ncbi:MAG: glycoside hydrolase family 38 C-terminal domain-containing protein [Thermomicrobiales bacterium]
MADKEAARDVLTAPGNQLWVYIDRPYTYDAWDVDETYERDGWQLTEVESVEIVESGPIRASIKVVRKFEESTIEQTYALVVGFTPDRHRNSRRLASASAAPQGTHAAGGAIT